MKIDPAIFADFAPQIKDFKNMRPWRLNGRQWLVVLKKTFTWPLIYVGMLLPVAFLVSWIFPVRSDAFFLLGVADAVAWPANLIRHLIWPATFIFSPDSGWLYKLFFYASAFLVYGGICIAGLYNFVYWVARFSASAPVDVDLGSLEANHFDPSKREIKIFISSTFQDMQEERDMLIIQVFPKLQEQAMLRRVRLVPIDLRWGITQAEAESGQVIGKCFDGIKNSSPFFIGLIGDRYGWVPTVEDFNVDATLLNRHPWLRDKIDRGISMTHLEFLYDLALNGALKEGRIFINGGSLEGLSLGKVGEFKRWIVDSGLFKYKHYLISQSLKPEVESYVTEILDKYYPLSEISEEEKILNEQEVYKFRYSHFYVPIEERDEKLRSFLKSDRRALIIYGEEGSGKRSTTVNICEEMTGQGVIKHPFYFFEMEDSSPDEVKGKCLAFKDISADTAVLHFKTLKAEEALRFIEILNDLSPDCRVIFLVDKVQPIDGDFEQIHFDSIGSRFRRKFFKGFFAQYMKKVSDEQLDRLASISCATSPAIVKAIADELLVLGKHELLGSEIEALSRMQDAETVFVYILKSALAKYDSDDYIPTIRKVIELEGKPRKEITEYMIKEERQFLDNFKAFENRRGKIYFAHPLYRHAAQHLFAK